MAQVNTQTSSRHSNILTPPTESPKNPSSPQHHNPQPHPPHLPSHLPPLPPNQHIPLHPKPPPLHPPQPARPSNRSLVRAHRPSHLHLPLPLHLHLYLRWPRPPQSRRAARCQGLDGVDVGYCVLELGQHGLGGDSWELGLVAVRRGAAVLGVVGLVYVCWGAAGVQWGECWGWWGWNGGWGWGGGPE